MTIDDVNNSQILEAMRPNGYKLIFVLGSFDERITFYSQQCRGLELIYALFHEQYLKINSKLGVIGGGAAGITAAYAAAVKGCRVSCFEKETLFSLQTNSNRFLHPHIYDWPKKGSDNPDAQLPILNWHADQASSVIENLRKEIKKFQKDTPERLSIIPKIVHKIEEKVNLNKVCFISNDLDVNEDFDIAIVAIGFGFERNKYDCNSEPYWNNDSLDGNAGLKQENILISGSGDGGLIDVARAALQNFNHSKLIHSVISCPKMRELAEKIYDIDNEYELAESPIGSRYEKYKKLMAIVEEKSTYLRGAVRKNRKIILNVRSNDVLSSNSSILNRLITLILVKDEIVRLHVGKLNEINRISDNNTYRVNIDGETKIFSRVVIRHGPNVEDHFHETFKSNKEFVDACIRDLNGKIRKLKLTGKLNKNINAWYEDSTNPLNLSTSNSSKPTTSFFLDQPWSLLRKSLAGDILGKLPNIFSCAYIYPYTIRSIENSLKGETVISNLTKHLKTNDPYFRDYHLKIENFLTPREELSSSTDIQSFFVNTKSFDSLLNYFANINDNLQETAILCGEKGSGKTVSVHHAIKKNRTCFEKNKVIVICCDVHVLYRFWEHYKAETRNTTVLDYNNFTFLFDLCCALNEFNDKANLLLDNINAKDLKISDYPQSRNNPESYLEPEPLLLEILQEISNQIKKKNYPSNKDYLHSEVLPSALNENSNKYLLRKWGSVVDTILKSLVENDYKILRIIDNVDSVHINVPESVKYYEAALDQFREFIQFRPARNHSHFLVTRQRTLTDVLKEGTSIISGSDRSTPTIIHHEAADMKEILNKRIELFNGFISSSGDNIYDKILDTIINDDRDNLNKIYHNNCRSYLANVDAWIAQAYYRIKQLDYPNKHVDIEEQVKHFRVRNLYLNGRLYLKTDYDWSMLNSEPGVWMYNLFYYPEQTNQIKCVDDWKGLCLIRVLQILKSVSTCTYSDITNYLKLGFKYEEKLIESHLINARAFGLIDSTSNDDEILYEISDKGRIACNYALSDIDTIYYFALDSAIPKTLVDKKFIRSHDNQFKVRTNYQSSVVISVISFLLFLSIVSNEEQKYFQMQEEKLKNSFNFMINPTFLPIFDEKTIKGIETNIETIYKSADEEEKKIIDDTIEKLLNFVS